MKHTNVMARKSQDSRQSVRDAARAGQDGRSLRPPRYGLGIVDHGMSAGALGAAATIVQPGGGMKMPANVRGKMEAAFGVDFSPVRIHEGSQAPAMGALAYTQGTDIHFAPGQYQPDSQRGQKLLGHELAHVVQQSQGRVQATSQAKGVGVNDDTGLEAEADAMGAKAARGEKVSAEAGSGATRMPTGSHFPENRGLKSLSVQAKGNVKQLYKQYPDAGETDPKTGVHWKSNGTPLRVAEDGTAAIAQARRSGGQEMYVDYSRLKGINADLKKVNAPVAFARKGWQTVEGAAPGDLSGPKKKLSRVKPVEPVYKIRVKKIPDDCGDAARTVTGTFAEGKTLKARYNDSAGTPKNTQNSNPELMKYEILVDHLGKEIPDSADILAEITSKIDAKGDLYQQLKSSFKEMDAIAKELAQVRAEFEIGVRKMEDAFAAYEAEKPKIPDDDEDKIAALNDFIDEAIAGFEACKTTTKAKEAALEEARNGILDKKIGAKTVKELMQEYNAVVNEYQDLQAAIMKPYNDLVQRDEFDKKVGINRYASPGVGEAYTISSGGNHYPGESTWNFHWGGVVFKSTTGSDIITLENYAGDASTEWRLQMYGVPTDGNARAGQTFHEDHEATHKHGDNPTTLATEKK